MTESVEFVAKSRFSFKTLFVILALLVVFEVIQQQNAKDIDIPEMAIGIYQQAVIFDRKHQQTWLVCLDEQRTEFIEFFNRSFEHFYINNGYFTGRSHGDATRLIETGAGRRAIVVADLTARSC